MSCGKPDDWENTKKQLISPNPIIKKRTWLNHGINTQAGIIDLMVLEGTHSIDQIASKIPEAINPIKRVKDHLEHLQEGDSRQKNTDMKPHKLRIVVGANDAVMFFSEVSYNKDDALMSNNSSYLPTKEDFESAYRMLARPGDSIQIDSVLNQIEANALVNGLLLKSDWRIVTEKNIKIWAKNK